MRNKLAILVSGAAIIFSVTPAFAHHSFAAEFDSAKPITLKGTITKLDFVNPHSWLYINVTEGGKVVNWAIEMGSPNGLIRRGVSKNSVTVGTEVTVEGYRAKDGSPTANGTTIRLPDGKQLFAGSSAPDAPGGERGR